MPLDFLTSGERSMQDLRGALEHVDRNIDSFKSILDFGCGCGRVIRWLHDHPADCALYGTDIDAEAIGWCQKNLGFAKFLANDPLPPLSFPDQTFDLVYSISIFTHLDETYQMAWLKELQRIVKPGGVALLSFYCDKNCGDLKPEEQALLQQRGFYYKVSITGALKADGLPDFYQTAYHTEAYVLDTCARFFQVRAFLDKGLENYQSIAVLERARTGADALTS